jgi:hypothetical protein
MAWIVVMTGTGMRRDHNPRRDHNHRAETTIQASPSLAGGRTAAPLRPTRIARAVARPSR